MWNYKSWLTTDLGTTSHNDNERLTDAQFLEKLADVIEGSRGYPDTKMDSVLLGDENMPSGIIIYLENNITGFSLNYSFRKEN